MVESDYMRGRTWENKIRKRNLQVTQDIIVLWKGFDLYTGRDGNTWKLYNNESAWSINILFKIMTVLSKNIKRVWEKKIMDAT